MSETKKLRLFLGSSTWYPWDGGPLISWVFLGSLSFGFFPPSNDWTAQEAVHYMHRSLGALHRSWVKPEKGRGENRGHWRGPCGVKIQRNLK